IEDSLAASTYQQLLRVAEPLRVPQGTVLIREGEQNPCLFRLESGSMYVSQSTPHGLRKLRTAEPGDVFGEASFVDQQFRLSTVTASQDAQLLKWDRATVLQILADNPGVVTDLVQALAGCGQRPSPIRVSHEQMRRPLSKMPMRPTAENAGAMSVDTQSADACLAELVEEAHAHPAVGHPYLCDLATGNLPDLEWALRDFAQMYPGYCAHFPRYLTMVISKLESPDHRNTLMQNLIEETGTLDEAEIEVLIEHGIDPDWVQGIPHPQLFERFQRALGLESCDADGGDDLEVVCWRESFYNLLASGSAAEAVGAIGLGTENVVGKIYAPIVRAIERLGTLDRRECVFFELHCEVDDDHHEALLAIARDFAEDPGNRVDLRKGMLKALGYRARFWDWMHQRARQRGFAL
ncbi:MAG: iron-containing redox enzyme family protein, partial [Planctomycetaceae bacterium]